MKIYKKNLSNFYEHFNIMEQLLCLLKQNLRKLRNIKFFFVVRPI